MHEAVRLLLLTVRPNAVTLVDAFEFPDNVLNSAIGRYDGRVYEALYEVLRVSLLLPLLMLSSLMLGPAFVSCRPLFLPCDLAFSVCLSACLLCDQSAKKSPLNTDAVRCAVHEKLSRVLDKDFIREHAKQVRWTPTAKL